MIKRAATLFILTLFASISIVSVVLPEEALAANAHNNCFFESKTSVRTNGACAVGGDTGNGEYGTNDVLRGRSTSGVGNGIPNSVTTKAEFINLISTKYDDTGHDHTGAGLIIFSMLHGKTGYDHTFPDDAERDTWVDRMNDPTVTIDAHASVSVSRTSWYVPSRNNVFFDDYVGGARLNDVLDVYQNGSLIARIERDCGNMTGAGDILHSWGPMSGTSKVTNTADASITTANPGQIVKWTHVVKNNGAAPKINSPTVSGAARWTSATAVNVPVVNRTTTGTLHRVIKTVKCNGAANAPDIQEYSGVFSNGETTTITTCFKIPGSAPGGTKYCQYVNGDPTQTGNLGAFASTADCVTINGLSVGVVPDTTITPSDVVGVGEHYDASATLQNTSAPDASITASWRTWLDGGDQTYGTAGDAPNGAVQTITNQVIAGGGTYTFGPLGGTADGIHIYVCTEIFNISGASGVTINPPTSKTCIPIAVRPYFSVIGGDTAAGPGFGVAGVAGAGIIGSNNDGTPNYNGATAQLAALALGDIKSFASGKNQNGSVGPTWVDSISTSSSPAVLAFANTPASSVPIYGGSFDQASWAVQNYYAEAKNGTSLGAGPNVTVNANTLASGTYSYSSGGILTLNSGAIARGKNIVIKVNGDVYITGGSGITYQPGGTLNDFPQFQLVVSGNIYVDHNITQLDGFYAAQGNGSTSGQFISCGGYVSGTLSAITDTTVTKAVAISTCNTSQLVVNGALAAQKVIFNRTFGDISGGFGAPQKPGEVIRYSPQLWLPSATGGSGRPHWDSVTSLPPIL